MAAAGRGSFPRPPWSDSYFLGTAGVVGTRWSASIPEGLAGEFEEDVLEVGLDQLESADRHAHPAGGVDDPRERRRTRRDPHRQSSVPTVDADRSGQLG